MNQLDLVAGGPGVVWLKQVPSTGSAADIRPLVVGLEMGTLTDGVYLVVAVHYLGM